MLFVSFLRVSARSEVHPPATGAVCPACNHCMWSICSCPGNGTRSGCQSFHTGLEIKLYITITRAWKINLVASKFILLMSLQQDTAS